MLKDSTRHPYDMNCVQHFCKTRALPEACSRVSSSRQSMEDQGMSQDIEFCHDLSCCSAGRSRGNSYRERVCAWQFVVTHIQSPSTLRVTFSLGKTAFCDSLLKFWLQDFRHICAECTTFCEVFQAPVAAVMKSETVVENGLDRQNSVQYDQQFVSHATLC